MDVCEAHVSIKNFATRQPYVTSDGQVSLNIPVESVEWSDVMFEAKVGDVSSMRIVFPSLLAFPGLRPLMQKIQEGDRVEIFNFQPDAGDPVMAGYIGPGGITEEDGKTMLTALDTLGQLKWQHLRRIEYLSAPASGLYDRARSIWTDLVNEDFKSANTSTFYGSYLFAPNPTTLWGQGFVKFSGTGAQGSINLYPLQGPGSSFTIQPGDAFIVEADVTLQNNFIAGFPNYTDVALQLIQTGNPAGTPPQVSAVLVLQNCGVAATPYEQWVYPFVASGGAIHGATSAFGGTNLANKIAMPATHHLSMYCHFDPPGTVTVYVYLDNVNVAFTSQPWVFDSTAYQPQIFAVPNTSTEYVQVSSWRVRRLQPALLRAARFNPQTADAVSYQPNNEDNLQFLQLIAEKDNAEYRPLYHAWPQEDELEVDAAGSLGKFASRTLGYEQPPRLPTEGSPQASPVPVIQDVASFLFSPPFRFEEGFNLGSAPKIQPRANEHANDVIRVGASSIDSQVFGEAFQISEVGAPQKGIAATYPYFEQITNDDRVGIQAIVQQLAGFELARRIDPTPSLELEVVDELPWAFRWRAGDQVFVKTLSLRTNLEQELRVQKIQYSAGNPLRTVTVGKTDWDPTRTRLLAEDTVISWLYEQSGTNPGIYVYPSSGNINSGATSAAFNIPLDQYTTGSALVYAALHWFTDANVLKVNPVLNGVQVDLTGVVQASGTDSGLVIVTNAFQGPGTYTLAFKNNDGSTRNLISAFLVLRIKA